jgi:alkanesulfonate monooxygenase SsuD/methylene tetrahydromethanopterin reductase-like flavin-dependent oxidoreductase (luciferase family)
MRVEATITAPSSIAELREHGRDLEAAGYDTILVPEAGHDPFLPIMTLAEHTSRPALGTGIAIAFPRSPMVTAQIAWDLQRFSGGRFLLGLGSQVRAHNERRYSTAWPSPPGPRLREYILCLKAIFNTFQTGARPDFQGDHYQFSLISPFFNPGPLDLSGQQTADSGQDPPSSFPLPPSSNSVPIYLSAVNRVMCRIVGELADGIRMHPLNTAGYIRDVIRPAIEEGCRKSGREISEIDIVANPFCITGENEGELAEARSLIRRHMSFYAATKTYFAVLEHHGWLDTGEHLVRLSREGRWDDMEGVVTDEMVDQLAITATFKDLPDAIEARYGGLVTSVNLVFGPPYQELQERQRRMFRRLGDVMDGIRAIA